MVTLPLLLVMPFLVKQVTQRLTFFGWDRARQAELDTLQVLG